MGMGFLSFPKQLFHNNSKIVVNQGSMISFIFQGGVLSYSACSNTRRSVYIFYEIGKPIASESDLSSQSIIGLKGVSFIENVCLGDIWINFGLCDFEGLLSPNDWINHLPLLFNIFSEFLNIAQGNLAKERSVLMI
jgi:hypothetical protein